MNETGRQQATKLAQRLAQTTDTGRLSCVYSSDLKRAHDTAMTCAASLGLPVIRDAAWRERNFGVLEGARMDQIEDSEAGRSWRSREADRPLEGGETLGGFRDRIVDTLTTLAQRHAGESVMVFTHGAVLDIVWRHVNDMPLDVWPGAPLINTALNQIQRDGQRWQVLRWGDAQHLD